MAAMHEDLAAALKEVLRGVDDQSPEFKRRLGRLIENATASNLADEDVLEVIELVRVDEAEED